MFDAITKLLCGVEGQLQPFFHSLGRFVARRAYFLAAIISVLLLGLGFCNLLMERENEAVRLQISQQGRIHRELSYYEDHYEDKDSRRSSFIFEPKDPDGELLTPEALEEIRSVEDWIRTYPYTHDLGEGGGEITIKLEDVCFKPVDLQPHEPCLHLSVIDCFREGGVMNPGGLNNTQYQKVYDGRPSYTDFNFTAWDEAAYRAQCLQWFQIGSSPSIVLGEPEWVDSPAAGEPGVKVTSLRTVFATRSAEGLLKKGVQFTTWEETPESTGEVCSDLTQTCEECMTYGLSDAAAARCDPNGAAQQPASCCEFMATLVSNRCVQYLWDTNVQVQVLGNVVLETCPGLSPIKAATPRCSNQAAITPVPALCSCLDADTMDLTQSDQCDAAVSASAEIDPPPVAAPVWAAAFGDNAAAAAQAAGAVKQALVYDVGCAQRTECTCLDPEAPVDGTEANESCTSGLIALAGQDPSAAPLVGALSAADPDEDAEAYAQARGALGLYLVQSRGCVPPPPTLCSCLDPDTMELTETDQCSAAVDASNALAEPLVTPALWAAAFGDDAAAAAQATGAIQQSLIYEQGCAQLDVCTCLDPQAQVDDSPEQGTCQAGALALAGSSTEAATLVGGLQALDEATQPEEYAAARTAFATFLVTEQGCVPPPPSVCSCMDSATMELRLGSDSCQATSAGDDTLSALITAAQADASQAPAVRAYLVNEAECEENAACGCLTAQDAACQTGLVALAGEVPAFGQLLVAFQSAAPGSQAQAAAQAEMGGYLVTQLNCQPPPETQTESTTPRSRFSTPNSRTQALPSEDVADALLHGWEKAWRRDIADHLKEADYQHIRVSWISSSSVDDVLEDAVDIPLIVIGYLLIGIYVFIVFLFKQPGSCHGQGLLSTVPPGPITAVLVYLGYVLSIWAAFGVFSLISLGSLKLSPLDLQVVPLLLLGLGINDFFLLAHGTHAVLHHHRRPNATYIDVMGDIMSIKGTSITLSSLVLIFSFALGALSPIPTILWFAVHMAIGLVFTYITTIFLAGALVALALKRHMRHDDTAVPNKSFAGPDLVVTAADAKGAPTLEVASSAVENIAAVPAGPFLTKVMASWVYRIGVLLCFAGLMAAMIVGVARSEPGFPYSKVVSEDHHTYGYLSVAEESYTTYPLYLVMEDGIDYSDPERLAAARALEFSFVNEAYKMDKAYTVTSVWDHYQQYTESKFQADDICMDEVEWVYDGFRSLSYGDPGRNLCLDGDDVIPPQECVAACESFNPQGPPGSKFRCELSEARDACHCPWRPTPKQELFYELPDGFNASGNVTSYWTDFLMNTSKGALSQLLMDVAPDSQTEKNTIGEPQSSRTLTYVVDVENTSQRLDALHSGRSVVDAEARDANLEAYPFDYVVYAIGEQYDDIGLNIIKAVALSTLAAMLIMLFFVVHVWCALLVGAMTIAVVVATVGVAHWYELDLSYSLFVTAISAVGLAVEFNFHVARQFMFASGSKVERAASAVASLGWPILSGALTTVLGVLPLLWSEYDYFREYFFGLFSIMSALSAAGALIVLPVILSIVGPDAFLYIPDSTSGQIEVGSSKVEGERSRAAQAAMQSKA